MRIELKTVKDIKDEYIYGIDIYSVVQKEIEEDAKKLHFNNADSVANWGDEKIDKLMSKLFDLKTIITDIKSKIKK